MKEKEFSEPEKLEIYIPDINYQLAEHIGNLCGYERYDKKTGKDKGHFHDTQETVILYVVKIQYQNDQEKVKPKKVRFRRLTD